jgi:PadR family transcriptional regulator PadR
MTQAQTNLLQGTLDMMILKSLALEQIHGLGIARRIEQITKGTFQVRPGSLFPFLHRMEEEGWLASSGESENNRRAKYYRLTKSRTPPAGIGNQTPGAHFAGQSLGPCKLRRLQHE